MNWMLLPADAIRTEASPATARFAADRLPASRGRWLQWLARIWRRMLSP